MKRSSGGLLGQVALAIALFTAPSWAQDYPTQPITLVVGYAPGALTDTSARFLAEKLSSQMNVPIVVENRPGASGHLAADFVAKSKPDGYTLMYNTADVATGPALGAEINYDITKDLVPVSLTAFAPLTLFINPSVPANNLQEFIAHVKAHPGKLHYASSGTGAPNHLGPLLFLNQNGLEAVHVPYKGGGPGMLDVVAGRVLFAMQTMTAVGPQAKEGNIKILAVASKERLPLVPEVPTFDESGMPGFQIGNWLGVLAPAGTPPEIVAKLNAEIVEAMTSEDLIAKMANEGAEVIASTPDEYGAYIQAEIERWTKVVKDAGVTLE